MRPLDPPHGLSPSEHGTLGPLALVLARLPVTSGGHHWRPVQTYSLQDPCPSPPVLTSSGEAHTASTDGCRAYYLPYILPLLVIILRCFRSVDCRLKFASMY